MTTRSELVFSLWMWVFFLNIHTDYPIRHQSHAGPFNRSALDADVQLSRRGIGSKARRFQGKISVGQQAFNHLVTAVVAEGEPWAPVALGGYDDSDAANILTRIGDSHFDWVIRMFDQGNIRLKNLAGGQLNGLRACKIGCVREVDGRVSVELSERVRKVRGSRSSSSRVSNL